MSADLTAARSRIFKVATDVGLRSADDAENKQKKVSFKLSGWTIHAFYCPGKGGRAACLVAGKSGRGRLTPKLKGLPKKYRFPNHQRAEPTQAPS